MSRVPFRALVVAAHPDDIEFGCAGTVAMWTDRGAEVTYCVATAGETGTQDRTLMGERLAAIRREETKKAAAVVGVNDIVFLDYPDGCIEYTMDVRRDLARVFRRTRPHRYVVMDPAPVIGEFINHPDHRAIAHASLDVAVTAGTTPAHFPELIEEGLQPWRGLRELWMAGPGVRPTAVDISATIDRKIEALLCHRTQVGDDHAAIAEWLRQRLAEQGKPHGYAYAETFHLSSSGPGFHGESEWDEADLELSRPPPDPAAAPIEQQEA